MPSADNKDTCQCGQRAVKFCRGCDLRYCEGCCLKRHEKGAFQRHQVVELQQVMPMRRGSSSPDPNQKSTGDDRVARLCQECGAASAVLWCPACELTYCGPCAQTVHVIGTMRSHAEQTPFQYLSSLAASSPENVSTTDKWASTAATSPEAARPDKDDDVAANNNNFENHLDRNVDDGAAGTSDESYDLWSGWSVRSFSDRSSSIDSTSQWRNLRSLSIDSKASSSGTGEEELQSISKSLQSLAFVDPNGHRTDCSDIFAQRPRSFSDYATSSSMHPDQSHDPDSPGSSSSMLLTLFKAIKTNFASRHVVLQSASRLEPIDVQQIVDTLSHVGALATTRDAFASHGLLFFTFLELKSAINAVKSWPEITSGGSSLSFCLPFEIPDTCNCATLLVGLQGPPIGSNEMRQFCSQFGEVASVLQNDIRASKYIVEFNDARDLPGAMQGLPCCFHAHGPITVSRSHPPTLDLAKLQLFQDALERVTALSTKRMSSSTASLLTSPSSTGSSPLSQTSYADSAVLEEPSPIEDRLGGRGFSLSSVGFAGTSPLICSGPKSPESPLWCMDKDLSGLRPRSSSATLAPTTPALTGAYSNPYAGASLAAAAHHAASMYLHNQQHQQIHHGHHHMQHHPHGYHGNGYAHPHPRVVPLPAKYDHFGHHHQQHQQLRRLANHHGNNDHGHSHSNNAAVYSTTAASLTGRHDQGTGEFSLSIDRVISGDDTRTTLMIRNIPNKYTQQMLLQEINQRHHGKYDFFYLPIDFKNKCNMGYAFINFMDPAHIVRFYQEFDNQKWTNFNSEKVCAISYARLQGKQAMITRFQNSSLLEKHESYRPLVFSSKGPNRGKPEPFPSPKQQPQHVPPPLPSSSSSFKLRQPYLSQQYLQGDVYPSRKYSPRQPQSHHSVVMPLGGGGFHQAFAFEDSNSLARYSTTPLDRSAGDGGFTGSSGFSP